MQFVRSLRSATATMSKITWGPSIKYVTLFWPILTPSLCHTVSHIPGPPESTSHISDPPIFSRPSTKNPDKRPLYKFSLNCSRRFLSEGLLSERFCPGGFCPLPLPSEYICYNRKLNITLDFIFHMYDKKIFIRVTSHAFYPLPMSQTVTPSRTPYPLERDVLYGRPLVLRSPGQCYVFRFDNTGSVTV